MTDQEKAKAALKGHSLALCKGDDLRVFDGKGIAPLVKAVESGSLVGYCAADTVVGKAAALLMINAGVKSVFAVNLSLSGKNALLRHGVEVSFDRLAEYIVNRDGTDLCPMEKTVADIDDPGKALSAIKRTLAALNAKNSAPTAE